jgi:putative tricarboxylic transport membrane protein
MGSVMLGGIITGKPPVKLEQATPIARLTTEYNVFVLPSNSPFKTMKDVVEQLKKDPGSVKWGGGSRGSTEHIAAAMIAQKVGADPTKINYVAFRGGGEYIAAGKMKAIAVTSAQRLPGINVPTLKEQGIDVEIGNWRGVYGAPGISAEQRKALTDMVLAAMKSASWAESLKKNDWTPAVISGDAFAKFVDDDFASLRAIMTKSGMV